MNQDSIVSATVRRWQLTETLRQLREEAGLTHDQVVAELRKEPGKWSRPKLSRIENREQGVKAREVEQLLDIYDLKDRKQRAWLLDLAQTIHQRGWTVRIRKDLPTDFHSLLDLEAALVALRTFETLLVPGLLQTPEYARALINAVNPGLATDEVERRVMARITRQQILARETPPQLHVILEECLFDRQVGKPAVMRQQLHRLRDTAEEPNVTVQVLPKAAGASPALEGPFSILNLPEPMPDIGYAEGPGRAVYIEDRDDVRAYVLRFGILTERSLSQADSLDVISRKVKEYE